MLDYIIDWYKSRKKKLSDYTICEFEWCSNQWVDKHHINCSYRGKRKHSKDWSDIINLCLKHHERIHNHNNFDNRQMLLDRVSFILKQINGIDKNKTTISK